MDDLISRHAAIDALSCCQTYLFDSRDDDKKISLEDAKYAIAQLPSAQPERLTDDDLETIRIHLNACKETLRNQHRWEEADEYQRIIDRFMAFAIAQPDVHDTNVGDTISRQAAIDALDVLCQEHRYKIPGKRETYSQYNEAWQDALDRAEGAIFNLPSAQAEPHWNVIHKRPMTEDERAEWSERLGYDIEYEDAFIYSNLPDDLAEVNITWVNHDPEPYYDFTKDKPASGSAVYYKGSWYWYSSTCVDILAEYGRNEMDKIDDAVEVTAWMPLPEPSKEREP